MNKIYWHLKSVAQRFCTLNRMFEPMRQIHWHIWKALQGWLKGFVHWMQCIDLGVNYCDVDIFAKASQCDAYYKLIPGWYSMLCAVNFFSIHKYYYQMKFHLACLANTCLLLCQVSPSFFCLTFYFINYNVPTSIWIKCWIWNKAWRLNKA